MNDELLTALDELVISLRQIPPLYIADRPDDRRQESDAWMQKMRDRIAEARTPEDVALAKRLIYARLRFGGPASFPSSVGGPASFPSYVRAWRDDPVRAALIGRVACLTATRLFPCPCCGYYTLPKPPAGSHATCPVCWWEDDTVQYTDPHYTGGANKPSLIQARRTFVLIGAKEERFRTYARPPHPDETPQVLAWSEDMPLLPLIIKRFRRAVGLSEMDLLLLYSLWGAWGHAEYPAPTLEELAAQQGFGTTPEQVHARLGNLEQRGLLLRIVRVDSTGSPLPDGYNPQPLIDTCLAQQALEKAVRPPKQ
jgi:hypothetical protein